VENLTSLLNRKQSMSTLSAHWYFSFNRIYCLYEVMKPINF